MSVTIKDVLNLIRGELKDEFSTLKTGKHKVSGGMIICLQHLH